MSYAQSPAGSLPAATFQHGEMPPPPPPKTTDSSSALRGATLPPQPPGMYPGNSVQELDSTPQLYRGATQQYQTPHVPPIDPHWLPETLKDKSTSDLHALLNDSSLQTALLDCSSTTHPAIPASQGVLQPLIASNISLASSLLELESQLQQQRSQIQSRLLALRALEQQHRTKLAETEQALQAFSPMALYKRLTASVQEQEALVQGIEESWLEEGGSANDREVADFVRRVRESQKVAFLRRERRERWDEGRVGGWR